LTSFPPNHLIQSGALTDLILVGGDDRAYETEYSKSQLQCATSN
jgi:hypothetical protein